MLHSTKVNVIALLTFEISGANCSALKMPAININLFRSLLLKAVFNINSQLVKFKLIKIKRCNPKLRLLPRLCKLLIPNLTFFLQWQFKRGWLAREI